MKNTPLFLLLISFLTLTACNSSEKAEKPSLAGNWILIAPDHQIKSEREYELYAEHQDSVVSLYGLKLLTLTDKGEFIQADSIQKPAGKWVMEEDSTVTITGGGAGFEKLTTKLKSLKNDTLQLTGYVPLEGKNIRMVWFLKRVAADDEAAHLYTPASNSWRKKPAEPESDAAMRERLSTILAYHSDYFRLVGREASYFIPRRVPLPFKYYQHAMGMEEELKPDFINLFYSEEQALRAHQILSRSLQTMSTAGFTSGPDFVSEYAMMIKKLSGWVKNQ